jgi:CRISP-associated protein Cas1
MATLYVDEQGAVVRKRALQVIVTKGGKLLREVPLNKVDRVVLMGRGVQISTALMAEFHQRGVPVMITNKRDSTAYGDGYGPSRLVTLRMKQMLKMTDPAWALEQARAIVGGKLANQRALLVRENWPAAPTAIVQIDNALAALAAAPTVDIVRGHEGAGAAAYFAAWRAVFGQQWGFGGRAYYPPPDPLNAVLSFGYTMLFHDVRNAVEQVGLDTYLGAFHAPEDGRPSLALDLMEEFRPLIVDRVVVELVSSGRLAITQFERPAARPTAVHLNDDGRELFIAAYEALMSTPVRVDRNEQTRLRRVLLLQAQSLARAIRDEQPRYTPYTPG